MARQHGLSGDDVDALEESLQVGQADTKALPSAFCPVCGSDQVFFLPLPDFYRENARLHGFERFGQGEMISLEKYSCNRCGASDRERLYALWVDQQLEKNALSRSSKVMHFAPEVALSKKLRQLFADYETADFGMEEVDYRTDIQNLPFADESYDFFICSHVLENVASDDLAIRGGARSTGSGNRERFSGPAAGPTCDARSGQMSDKIYYVNLRLAHAPTAVSAQGLPLFASTTRARTTEAIAR